MHECRVSSHPFNGWQLVGGGWEGGHRVERAHSPALQRPVLVLLHSLREWLTGDWRQTKLLRRSGPAVSRWHQSSVRRPWGICRRAWRPADPTAPPRRCSFAGEHRAQGRGHNLLLRPGHRLQEVAGEGHATPLPGAALDHPAHRLGEPDVGVADDEPHASESPPPEAAEALPPERFPLAPSHPQTQLLGACRSNRHAQAPFPPDPRSRFRVIPVCGVLSGPGWLFASCASSFRRIRRCSGPPCAT